MAWFHSLFVPSLRNRLLVLTVALVALISGSLVIILRNEVQSLTDERLSQEYANTYRTFQRFLTLRNERLVESCLLISELPVLKAQVSTRDPATLKDYILLRDESPARVAEVDLFTLTDEHGRVLFRLDRPEKNGDTIADLPTVRKALEGADPSGDDISIWVIEDRLFQTVTVPIVQRYVLGTLTLGRRITQDEAVSLKEDTHSDITVFLGNRIVASTLSDLGQVDLLRSYVLRRAAIDSVLGSGGTVQQADVLNGEKFMSTFARASRDSRAVTVISVSADQAVASFKRIERVFLYVSIAALLLALLGAYALSERITSPIRTLVRATEQIRAGNYDIEVALRSRDELGMLARSFNEMVLGLKERLLMSKFISTSTVNMIRRDGGNLRLGGMRRNVTVLFSDIRDFTAFSERVEPETVIELLNAYLGAQTSIVMNHGGIVDKYVGDELIAVFEGEDMANRAVACAVDMQREIDRLRRNFAEHLHIGIGVNTGMAIVGNVGGTDRMDHTVLGNNMNLGARLCSAARPGQIIISESTWRLLTSSSLRTRPLDAISVKGISRPVQTYEVLAGTFVHAPTAEE